MLYSQRQAAFGETKAVDNLCVFLALFKLVFAHDADVGHTAGYTLGNIVIAQEEYFQGEVGALDQKSALTGIDFDVSLCEEIHAVVVETAF